GMDADPFFAEEDLAAARELAKLTWAAELFLYPGDKHLFTDPSLPDYDEAAAALLMQRVLGFLGSTRRFAPDPAGGERELLGQYLDFQRQTVLAKTEGLNREQMARRHPPSALTLAVLLHLLEETARHAGHADVIREAIDGIVGE